MSTAIKSSNSQLNQPKKKGFSLFNFGKKKNEQKNIFGSRNNSTKANLFSRNDPLKTKVPKAGKKGNNVFTIVLVLILLVGLGVGGYFLYDKVLKDKDENNNNNSNENSSDENTLKDRLNSLFSNDQETPTESTLVTTPPPPPTTQPPDPNEVFSTSENIWTYDDAEAVCASQGSKLASYDQLVEAAENGAHWCNLGWVKSDTTDSSEPYKYAHFPVQKKEFNEMKKSEYKDGCGAVWNDKFSGQEHSVQGGAYNKNRLLAVNCYGEKREPKIDETNYLEEIQKGPGNLELENKMIEIKDLTDNMSYYPYNKNQWSSLNPL